MDDILFQSKIKYTFEEYKKFNRAVQNGIGKLRILEIALIALLILLAILEFISGNMIIVIFYIIMAVLVPPLLRLVSSNTEKKSYYSNKNLQEAELTISFYDNYLEQANEIGCTKFKYDNIYKIIETKTNFYVMTASNQGIIIVKQNCSPDLIAFIKNIMIKV